MLGKFPSAVSEWKFTFLYAIVSVILLWLYPQSPQEARGGKRPL